MSFAGAITALSALSVSGVTANYGIDEFYPPLVVSQLPALVVELAPTGGEGFTPLVIDASEGLLVIRVNHILAYGVIGLGGAVARAGVVALLDNYMTALKANWTLSGNLYKPALVAVQSVGEYAIAGTYFHAVVLNHRWVVTL